MRILLVLAVVVATVSTASYPSVLMKEWIAYKMANNKIYAGRDLDMYRMNIFAENKHKIAVHNEKYRQGIVTFRMRQNKYGDLLNDEFVMMMNGYNRTGNDRRAATNYRPATFIQPGHVSVPAAIDWRDDGAVTAVKDQGRCSSCWAFSSTGALEGQQYRKSGFLISLSEQNLIDCSTEYGNMACNGGLMENAYQYVRENGGIDTEITYPYQAKNGTCRYNPFNSGADTVGVVNIPSGDEPALLAAVATIGPISVAIDASLETFQLYSDGVYYDENCSSEDLDHAVLLVGYGTDAIGGDYWLVKNSWGLSWGEAGYIRIARNRGNHCGIAAQASYPLMP